MFMLSLKESLRKKSAFYFSSPQQHYLHNKIKTSKSQNEAHACYEALISLFDYFSNLIMFYNFSFLIEKKFQKLIKFIAHFYLSLLNSFLFLSRFSVSLKSLNNYFFRRFAYKSLLNRFSVLINYIMWSSNHFSTSSCFPRFSGSRFFGVQVFQGLGSSGSRFFMVQVFLGPGFSGSGSTF